MATLDDKLLGEKTHYYCSSSEDEDESSSGNEGGGKTSKGAAQVEPEGGSKTEPWTGTSSNTGPKGVIKDWQRFKQLEAESAAEKERERLALFKKLSLTCSSTLDDEKQKQDELDEELADDEFLQQYVQQRMAEMVARSSALPVFGKVCFIFKSCVIVYIIKIKN
jgi:hypothetical protein